MCRIDCMCPGCKQKRDDMRKKNKTTVICTCVSCTEMREAAWRQNMVMRQTQGWSYTQLGTIMNTVNVKENKMIKVGDVVRVRSDYSYSRAVVSKKLKEYWYPSRIPPSQKYTVVVTDCSFPMVNNWQDKCNDTVIQDNNSGLVVFIRSDFLIPAARKIIIDGKTIELSEKSFQNLKEQLCQTS